MEEKEYLLRLNRDTQNEEWVYQMQGGQMGDKLRAAREGCWGYSCQAGDEDEQWSRFIW